LDFQEFSGSEFDAVIEQRFREWALRVFGGTSAKLHGSDLAGRKSPGQTGVYLTRYPPGSPDIA